VGGRLFVGNFERGGWGGSSSQKKSCPVAKGKAGTFCSEVQRGRGVNTKKVFILLKEEPGGKENSFYRK